MRSHVRAARAVRVSFRSVLGISLSVVAFCSALAPGLLYAQGTKPDANPGANSGASPMIGGNAIVTVYPSSDNVVVSGSSTHTYTFSLGNSGTANAVAALSIIECTGAVNTCSVSPSSVSLVKNGGSGTATVTYHTAATGTGELILYVNWGSGNNTSATLDVAMRSATPSVTASPTVWTAESVSTNDPGFTITNNGNTAAQYTLTASCTGNLNSYACSASPSTTVSVAPHGSTTATLNFQTGAYGGGNGTITLTAQSPFGETGSEAVTIVILSEKVSVATQTAPTPPNPSGSATYGFTINATGNNTSPVTYSLASSCSGALSCGTTPSPSSVSITPSSPGTANVVATATSNVAGGSGTVSLTATFTDSWGHVYTNDTSYSVTVPPAPDYTPGVVPLSGEEGALVFGHVVVDTFTVRNQGNHEANYYMSPSCDGSITTTCFLANSMQAHVDLLPGETAQVPVRWEASGSGMTSHVRLTASYTDVHGVPWTNTGTRILAYYPWVAPSVTAQGIPPGGFNEGGIGLIQSFTVTNNGSAGATYEYDVSCADDVGQAAIPVSCAIVSSPPPPYQIAAGATDTVRVRFNAGDAGTSSTMTLTVSDASIGGDHTNHAIGTATIVITQHPATITTATPSVAELNGASETHSFVIHNPNAVAETYSWSIACHNAASCTPSSISIGLGAQEDTSLSASYTTSGAPNAMGSVVATVSNFAGTVTDSILVRIKSYMVQIAPVGSPDTVASGVLDTATFTVKNIGLDSMAYTVTASCDGTAATACQQPSTPVSLLPSQQKTVTVRFTGGGTDYSSGAVTLHVVANDGGTYSDSSAFVVNVHSPNAVHVSTAFMNNDDQDMSLCVASCFAMTASRSTVPYYTLGTPRSVTLAYNGDRAFPRPFVYADVSVPSAPANISSYTLEVKRLGAHLFFTNGDSVLTFAGTSSPATTYRLAGQLDMSSYGTGIDSVTLVVTAHYANGGSDVTPVKTELMIVNSTLNTQSSPVAKGWTIAGLQHFRPTPEGLGSPSGGYMIENGDGSATYFASNGAMASDFSTLHFDNVATWIRTYQDSSKVLFDGGGRMLAAIDRLGRQTTFKYGGLDSLQVTNIIEPMRSSGSSTSAPYLVLSYDANHHLQSITETGGAGGRTTNVTVDPTTGHLTRFTDPDGKYDSYGYDGSGRLHTITDRRGNTTTYSYDATWKLSQIISPSVPIDNLTGGTTTGTPTTNLAAWQAVGVPTLATASNPAPLLNADTIAARVTDPKGYVSTIYPDRWGEPLKTVDALGNVTTIARQGFLPTVIMHPDSSVDSATYNPSNGLLLTQRSAGQQTVSYTYGVRNQLQTVSGSGVVSVTNSLDTLGRVLRTHYGTVLGDTTRFTYDPVTKNVATMFRADTGLVTYQYDPNFGNLSTMTDPGNRITRTYFDAYGRDTATKTPQYARTRVVYDSLNRVTASYDSVGANPIRIKYDAMLPVSVRDQLGHVDSTEYDALGRATRHFGYASSTLATTARYDLDSRPTSTTNRRGQRIDLTYDALGRVLSKSGGNNETTTDSFTYSSNGLIQTAANSTDSMRTVSVPSALLDTVQTTMLASGVTHHTYTVVHYHSADAGGTDSTTISSDGAPAQFVTRRYVADSTNGALTKIDLGSAIGHGDFAYDAAGRRVTSTWPAGISETDRYLSTGGYSTRRFQLGLGVESSLSYRADSAGRIRGDSRAISTQATPDTTNRIFGYDALGRYTGTYDVSGQYSWTCTGDVDIPDPDYGQAGCPIDDYPTPHGYSYDDAGNRKAIGDSVGVGDQMRTAGYLGALLNYTYDADGNVLTRSAPSAGISWTYNWSSDNRLLGGTSALFGTESLDYDALGQPVVMRDSNGVVQRVTLYDGGNVLADLDSVGNRLGEYVYDAGTDRPYALLTGPTTVTGEQYFIQDALGDVQGTVTDSATGSLAVGQSITYLEWGYPTESGDSTNRLMWKGLPFDSVLSLTHVRARWYDPIIGRFVSEDPIGLAGGINPYVFANNDPVNGSDPSGMDAASCQEVYRISHGDDTWYELRSAPADLCDGGGGGNSPIFVDPFSLPTVWSHPDPMGPTQTGDGTPEGASGASKTKQSQPSQAGLGSSLRCFKHGGWKMVIACLLPFGDPPDIGPPDKTYTQYSIEHDYNKEREDDNGTSTKLEVWAAIGFTKIENYYSSPSMGFLPRGISIPIAAASPSLLSSAINPFDFVW